MPPSQPSGCRRYKRTDDRRLRTDDLIPTHTRYIADL
jgi:hypothetical protein